MQEGDVERRWSIEGIWEIRRDGCSRWSLIIDEGREHIWLEILLVDLWWKLGINTIGTWIEFRIFLIPSKWRFRMRDSVDPKIGLNFFIVTVIILTITFTRYILMLFNSHLNLHGIVIERSVSEGIVRWGFVAELVLLAIYHILLFFHFTIDIDWFFLVRWLR